MSIKAEMEVAMKLLEKDIHEKQDTVISLRRQLDDINLRYVLSKLRFVHRKQIHITQTPAKTALNAPKIQSIV
jgi:hypothetical protein